MDYLAVLYFILPIVLIFWVKNNTDINIRRVLILSFIPLFISSIIMYLYTGFSTGRWLNSLNLIILMNFFGYIFYYPILVLYSLSVKVLSFNGNSISKSASIGALLPTMLVILFSGDSDILFISFSIFTIGFLSAFIDAELFNKKSDKPMQEARG